MGATQRVFRAASAVLFGVSLIVHSLACTRLAPDWGKYPFLLHIGVFVIAVPTILALVTRFGRQLPPGFLLELWRSQPPRLRACSTLVLGYAVASFVLFVAGVYGDPEKDDLVALRGFSGHWMAFYWMFFALLRQPL